MSLATSPQHNPALNVATVAELQVLSTGGLVDGDMAFVALDQSVWRLSKSSTTTVTADAGVRGILYNGDSTLGVGAGRWFRLGINGMGGNTIIARQTGDDAAFFPLAGLASKLSCVITTSSTRLWVEFTASGVSGGATTAVAMQLYVNTVAVTGAAGATPFGGGGAGTTNTIVAVTNTFNLSYKRLLTGLTAGVNTIGAYCVAVGGNAAVNVAATATHHATLRVTEV